MTVPSDTSPVPTNPAFFYIEDFDREGAEARYLDDLPAVMRRASQRKSASPSSASNAYLRRLWTIPVLTARQEQQCFARLNYLKYRQFVSVDRKNGDWKDLECETRRVRDFLVESNLRLVVSIAKRHSKAMTDSYEELVALGNETLMRTVDLFDFRRGLRFSTYAHRAIERRFFTHHRNESKFHSRFCVDHEVVLLQETKDAGQSDRMMIDAKEAKACVATLIEQLDDRERLIVMARFGIGRPGSGQTFRAIAKELKLSASRTVQLFHRGMERMRHVAVGNENRGERYLPSQSA